MDSIFEMLCATALLVIILKKYIRVFSQFFFYYDCMLSGFAKDQHNVATAISILFCYFEFCVQQKLQVIERIISISKVQTWQSVVVVLL